MKSPYFSSLMMFANMMAMDAPHSFNHRSKRSIDSIDFTTKKPPIPKGCKEYTYHEDFGTLTVVAISQKSADKKYQKWCEKNKK